MRSDARENGTPLPRNILALGDRRGLGGLRLDLGLTLLGLLRLLPLSGVFFRSAALGSRRRLGVVLRIHGVEPFY